MNAHRRTRTERARQAVAGAYALAAFTVALSAAAASLDWIGRTFPGFFLMGNRVVPSVTLGHWSGAASGSILQAEVFAVDGEPVITADAVYRRVGAGEPDEAHVYTLRRGSGVLDRAVRSMRFTGRDYLWFFGPLILNGLVFTAVGIAIWVLGRPSLATVAAALFTLDVGLFCLTALDLYGPGRFFRVHAATEALLPATLLYLALVFPVARLRRRTQALLAIAAFGVALVALYERLLYLPAAYSVVHNACMVLWGLGGTCFIASSVHAYLASPSVLVRKRLGIVALGLVAGLSVPAWVMTSSGFFGGEAALNLAGFTAFIFPLSLAYAVVKHDLFEIDAMLRRGLGYLAVTGVVVVVYTVLVLGAGLVLQSAALAGSPFFALVFSVLMILFFNPVRERIQGVIDRGFHRTSYDPQRTLERASSALASTLALEDIYRLTIETPCTALLVDDASLWMRDEHGQLAVVEQVGAGGGFRGRLTDDHRLIARLRSARRALTVYDCDAQEEAGLESDRSTLALLGAELVLPIGIGDLAGFLALGRKRSHTLFTLDDLAFLSTFANQVAVAVRNAQSYRKIEHLNQSLEQKVAERTNELESSLRALEDAYAELQQSQERLLHAEKMAALGRLTSGIAHEVNTPLGATMNGLKIVADLADEYARSIDDPEVTPADHHEMAAELRDLIGKLSSWTEKAAGYIRGIKAHTRGIDGGREEHFEIGRILEDVQGLLAHRLRLSSCTLAIDCPPALGLYGDPGRLSQVVTNLITNAIDAYDGLPNPSGAIRIRATDAGEYVQLAVEDDGSGIAPADLERIFDELFSTKPQGKGTGLGLSIARDIVRDCFRGRIDVASTLGRGSRFTLMLPRRAAPVAAQAAT